MQTSEYSTVYIAAPFFTPTQVERVARVEQILQKYSWLQVISPRHYKVLDRDSTGGEHKDVFQRNISDISRSRVILALTDEHDTGTYFEIGFGYGADKMVVLVQMEKPGVNVMLLEACMGVLKNWEALEEFVAGKDYKYAHAELHGSSWDFNWESLKAWKGEVY